MSLRAMLWAYDQAPVEQPTQVLVLFALADEANDEGRNAFPSVARIARRARCQPRAAKYALRGLEAAGIIVRGDQEIAARHIARADRRPVVYDLVMSATWDDRPTPAEVPEAPEDAQVERGAPDAPRERGAPEGTNGVHADVERGAPEGTNGVHPGAPDPSMTRGTTDPTTDPGATSSRRKPERPVPDDFVVTAQMKAWFEAQPWAAAVLRPGIETENFLGYHRARGTLFRDWVQAWQTWMRNAGTKYAEAPTNRHDAGVDTPGHAQRMAAFGGRRA